MQFDDANVLDLPRPFLVGDVGADHFDVLIGLVRFAFQQFLGLFINLPVALGKAVNQFLADAFNLKIAAWTVLHTVAGLTQRFDQLVIIDVLDELLRRKHFAGFQRLPTPFHIVKGCIKQDAVTMQVRV